MKYFKILLISTILLTISSCSEESFTLLMSFSNTSNGARFAARTAAGDPYIGDFSLFDDAYDLLGDQVDFSGSVTLSPSSFIVFLDAAYLGGPNNEFTGGGINLGVPYKFEYTDAEYSELVNVDFCDPYTYEIGDFLPSSYNTLYILFLTGYGTQTGSFGTIDIEREVIVTRTPFVEVTVPGYTDIDWPDQTNLIGITTREYLGNNKFRFQIDEIFPTVKDINGITKRVGGGFVFCSDYTSAGAIFPGLDGYPEIIDTRDYGYVSEESSIGGETLLLLPFNEIYLDENTTLVFYFETDDILTVYDNNTPADKSDDLLMLVKDYYNHIGVRTE